MHLKETTPKTLVQKLPTSPSADVPGDSVPVYGLGRILQSRGTLNIPQIPPALDLVHDDPKLIENRRGRIRLSSTPSTRQYKTPYLVLSINSDQILYTVALATVGSILQFILYGKHQYCDIMIICLALLLVVVLMEFSFVHGLWKTVSENIPHL